MLSVARKAFLCTCLQTRLAELFKGQEVGL